MEQKLRGTRRTGLSVSLTELQTIEATKVWSSYPHITETQIYMAGIKYIQKEPLEYDKKEE